MRSLIQDARRTGEELSAPTFAPFCRWIVEQARRLSLSHLIFLARDGQLLHAMTRKLFPDLKDLELIYSYAGSRASWYPCLPHSISQQTLLFRIQSEYKTVENTCRALGLNLDMLPEGLDLPAQTILDPKEAQLLALRLSDDIGSEILKMASRRSREIFTRYFLDQQGIGDGCSIGIVDLGWNGTFQTALAEILPREREVDIFGLYFGLNQNVDRFSRLSFAYRPRIFPHWFSMYPCWLEMLSPADHAPVTGFTNGNCVKPVFRGAPVADVDVIHALHAGGLAAIDAATPPPNLLSYVQNPPPWLVNLYQSYVFQSPFFPDENESFVVARKTSEALHLRLSLSRRLSIWHWPQANLIVSRRKWLGTGLILQFQIGQFLANLTKLVKNKASAAWHTLRSLVQGAVPRSRIDVVSFDLFDTLIFRACGSPQKVFDELEASVGFPQLARIRKSVESSLLFKARQGEISYDEIYAALAKLHPDADWESIKRKELEIETRNLMRSPPLNRILNVHRSAGRRVVFISDMYHPARWIQQQLDRLEIWREGDTLIVSSEFNTSKRQGPLYAKAREIVPSQSWVHYGDNLLSDIVNAHAFGLRPRWRPHSYRAALKAIATKIFSY